MCLYYSYKVTIHIGNVCLLLSPLRHAVMPRIHACKNEIDESVIHACEIETDITEKISCLVTTGIGR